MSSKVGKGFEGPVQALVDANAPKATVRLAVTAQQARQRLWLKRKQVSGQRWGVWRATKRYRTATKHKAASLSVQVIKKFHLDGMERPPELNS